MMKQILCIKWGQAYGPIYVNILYAMVARHITGEFTLYCLTDDSRGVRPEVQCLALPPLGCEIPADVPGKWRKSILWSRDLFGLKGPALFLDLDSIIVANIDGYFTHGNPSDVIVARNWIRRFGRSGQTSVFRFPIGEHAYMLDQLRADPVSIARHHRWEQNYVTRNIRGGVKYWPEPWTRHFRRHCAGAWPVRFFRPPQLPAHAKIVTFPGGGGPKPDAAAAGRWSPEQQARHLNEHLREVWRQFRTGDGQWRHQIKQFMLPAAWITDNWRE